MRSLGFFFAVASLFFTHLLCPRIGLATAEPGTGSLDGQVQRIVSINSTVAEILVELGLGDRLVGTDNSALYPESVGRLPKLGHPYRIGAEGVLSLRPDLVIATEDNLTPVVTSQLRAVGTQVLLLPPSDKGGLESLYRRIELIAEATGMQAAGEKLKNRIAQETRQLEERIASRKAAPPTVLFLYAHGGGAVYAYGRETGTECLLQMSGAINAADFSSGRVAFNAEAIVKARPDAIVLLQRSFEAVGGVDGVLKMPGVGMTPAGRQKRIYTVDDSVRWIGPRFPQFARMLGEAMGTIDPVPAAVTVSGADGVSVTVDQPRRLAVLNASVLDILLELGLKDRIIAADGSGFGLLDEAQGAVSLGHPYRWKPQDVLELQPDLVLGSRDNLSEANSEALRSGGLPVLVLSRSDTGGLDALRQRITLLGEAFGRQQAAARLLARLDEEQTQLPVPGAAGGLRMIFLYPRGASNSQVYGTHSGTHTLMELAGGVNAATFAQPQVLSEQELVALKPEVILVMSRAWERGGAELLLKIPGVSETPAGKAGRFVVIDNSARWIGPKFPSLARDLSQSLEALQARSAP